MGCAFNVVDTARPRRQSEADERIGNDLGAVVAIVELTCIIKLCSLACTLLAAGSKAFDYEFASHLFEAGDKTGEAALAFHEGRERGAVQAAVRDLRKRVERDCGEWLATEFRGDPAGLADARAAILSLDFVLPRCLPRAEAVIAAKYDAAEIASLVVRTAGQSDDQFRDGRIGARLLHCLVQRAFEALQEDEAFCRATEIPFRREVLRNFEELKRGQEDIKHGQEEIKRGQAALPEAVAEATVAKLLAALDARGGTERAEAAGLERRAVIALAQRIKPELLDFDQALVELESAVGIALDVIARGARGTNLDAFVDAVLARVAETTKAGDFDGGARAVDDALAELDRREAGRAGRAGAAEGGAARGRATQAGRPAGTRGGAGHPAPRRGRCCAPDRGGRRRRGRRRIGLHGRPLSASAGTGSTGTARRRGSTSRS